MALIAALRAVPSACQNDGQSESEVTVFSDSILCVKTLTEWAAGWEHRGWIKSDRKPPENLDLVQEAWALIKARPHVKVQWVKGHAGNTWNEVADVLANSAVESTLEEE